MDLKVTLTDKPKAKFTDEGALGFGRIFTDHMFTMEYEKGKGWFNHKIIPYSDFVLDPATVVFHYGQEIFEGMKAYRDESGAVRIFRAERNFARMNDSCERLCMAKFDEKEAMEALIKLLEIEKDWIPTSLGTSLYIRPFMIGTDVHLGVAASEKYLFAIILSPSGPYYKNGLAPVGIYVEDEYVRAVKGGTGAAKAGGNYAASILAGQKAKEKGYSQVLWLDSTKTTVEEVGAMNIFFVIDGVLVTPQLNGSILPGITRDSVITLAKSLGIKVEEREVTIEEIAKAHKEGKLNECFGSGTAAVISPVGELCYKGEKMVINENKMGEKARLLYDKLTDIQYKGIGDSFGWSKTLEF
ncbi:MAG: branched-chain amino acid aminotransferase [Clostridia bacterium]|nr:branched-chain amino acid aminotransferase [Clostridia bacterium]